MTRNLSQPALSYLTPLSHRMICQESSGSTQAPVQRKRRATKEPPFDEDTQLSQAELDRWITDNAVNMAKATKGRRRREASSLAKNNAAYWVFGVGIGGVGAGIGSSKLKSPLDMFASDALMEALTGSESSPAGGYREVEALTAKGSSPAVRKREVEFPGMKELSQVRRKRKLEAPTASKSSLTDDDFNDTTTLKRQRKPELLTPLVSPDSTEATTGHRSTTTSCSPSVATQDISQRRTTAADLSPPNVRTRTSPDEQLLRELRASFLEPESEE